MGAPRRFFRRGGGFRGSRGGAGGPPRRPYQDENQVIKYFYSNRMYLLFIRTIKQHRLIMAIYNKSIVKRLHLFLNLYI